MRHGATGKGPAGLPVSDRESPSPAQPGTVPVPSLRDLHRYSSCLVNYLSQNQDDVQVMDDLKPGQPLELVLILTTFTNKSWKAAW